MAQKNQKTVLFLDAGNYHRARLAEAIFHSVAAKMRLPWAAASRNLAPERDAASRCPLAAGVVDGFKKMGISTAEVNEPANSLTLNDLEQAARIVALHDAEHRALLAERFPDWVDKVEFWDVPDESAFDLIEREVMALVARIFSGGVRTGPPPLEVDAAPTPKASKKPLTAKVGRETKGRRGKGVTTIFELPLNQTQILELAALLKQRCGTGGTVKDKVIEIQGDQRERIVAELEKLGYKVKRVGG